MKTLQLSSVTIGISLALLLPAGARSSGGGGWHGGGGGTAFRGSGGGAFHGGSSNFSGRSYSGGGSPRMGGFSASSYRGNPTSRFQGGAQYAGVTPRQAAFNSGQWRGDRSWQGGRNWNGNWRGASNWREDRNWNNRNWSGNQRWHGDRRYRAGGRNYAYGIGAFGAFGYPFYYNNYNYGGYDPYYYGDDYYNDYPAYGTTTDRVYYARPVTATRTVAVTPSVTVELQRRLARAGFYYGPIDGIVGPGTRAAIVAYERSRQLPVIAAINAPLLRDLGIV